MKTMLGAGSLLLALSLVVGCGDDSSSSEVAAGGSSAGGQGGAAAGSGASIAGQAGKSGASIAGQAGKGTAGSAGSGAAGGQGGATGGNGGSGGAVAGGAAGGNAGSGGAAAGGNGGSGGAATGGAAGQGGGGGESGGAGGGSGGDSGASGDSGAAGGGGSEMGGGQAGTAGQSGLWLTAAPCGLPETITESGFDQGIVDVALSADGADLYLSVNGESSSPPSGVRRYQLAVSDSCQFSLDQTLGTAGVIPRQDDLIMLGGDQLYGAGFSAFTRLLPAPPVSCDSGVQVAVLLAPGEVLSVESEGTNLIHFDDQGCTSDPISPVDGLTIWPDTAALIDSLLYVGGHIQNAGYQVQIVDLAKSKVVGTLGSGVFGEGFCQIQRIAPCGGQVCVLDANCRSIGRFNAQGQQTGTIDLFSDLGLDYVWPTGLVFAGNTGFLSFTKDADSTTTSFISRLTLH